MSAPREVPGEVAAQRDALLKACKTVHAEARSQVVRERLCGCELGAKLWEGLRDTLSAAIARVEGRAR